jgi:integrase
LNPGWKLGSEGAPPLSTPHDELLAEFREFCLIDLQLKQPTVNNHLGVVNRLLQKIQKPANQLSVNDLRTYLQGYLNKSPSSYSNQIKSFRRFFRDFLGADHLITTFQLPKQEYKPIIIPTKNQLTKFYATFESKRDQALFLMFATSGLRKAEVLSLRFDDVDLERRMVYPKNNAKRGSTKRSWISFYNHETASVLDEYLTTRKDSDQRVFSLSEKSSLKTWKKVSKRVKINIMPQLLRRWFCCEMGRLGVPDRYVNAFCGRTPKSVIARHYTDYTPTRLQEIYERANLTVLS